MSSSVIRLSLIKSKTKLIAITFILLLAIGNSLGTIAQQCISNLSGFRVGTKLPEADGLIHITYATVDEFGNPFSPPQAVATAIQTAINNWNQHSGTTGVIFEPAPPGTRVDLQFQSDPNIRTPCAEYSPESDRIYYNPAGFQEAAELYRVYAAGVIAHELGHFLGIDHTGPSPATPTVMNAPIVEPGDRCIDLEVDTSTIQPSDVTKAASCVSQARQQNTVASSPYNYSEYNYSYGCYTYYEVTDYYLCHDGGCSYWYSEYRYLGSNCMLTQ